MVSGLLGVTFVRKRRRAKEREHLAWLETKHSYVHLDFDDLLNGIGGPEKLKLIREFDPNNARDLLARFASRNVP